MVVVMNENLKPHEAATEEHTAQAWTPSTWIASYTFNNLEEVRASTHAVCLYCKCMIDVPALFRDHPLDDICLSWIDEDMMEETVFCQHSGIDAVIGDASGLPVTTPEFIDKLHERALCAPSEQRPGGESSSNA